MSTGSEAFVVHLVLGFGIVIETEPQQTKAHYESRAEEWG